MLLRIAQLVGLAITVVLLTRLVVRGIELHAEAGAMSSKAKGQFLGYATSIPELAGTVGTAGHGLLTAGLWNIASSNVINWALFLLAAVCYRRTGALLKRRFRDEIGFAVVAVAIPLVLSRQRAIAGSPWTALALFGLFVGYVYLDRHLNPNPPPSVAASRRRGKKKSHGRALLYTISGVIGIVVTGHFLGVTAKSVVVDLGVPQWAVGWTLGVITSLPEMAAFFAVFATAKAQAWPGDADCQENLDSLAASNMSNLGLIYPIGIMVFLLVAH